MKKSIISGVASQGQSNETIGKPSDFSSINTKGNPSFLEEQLKLNSSM